MATMVPKFKGVNLLTISIFVSCNKLRIFWKYKSVFYNLFILSVVLFYLLNSFPNYLLNIRYLQYPLIVDEKSLEQAK